jgi:hypothetical protein
MHYQSCDDVYAGNILLLENTYKSEKVISLNRSSLFAAVIIAFGLSILLTACGGGSSGSGGSSTATSSGTPVAAAWQGQWKYVDSGTAITIGGTTTLNLSQGDANQLIETRTVSAD